MNYFQAHRSLRKSKRYSVLPFIKQRNAAARNAATSSKSHVTVPSPLVVAEKMLKGNENAGKQDKEVPIQVSLFITDFVILWSAYL